MDNDEELHQNCYWTLLKMEWDTNSIDLDETYVPSDNYYPIKHSNFYKGSLFSVYESLFGIEMLNKIVNSNNIHPMDVSIENETVNNYSNNSNYDNEFDCDEKVDNIFESVKECISYTKKKISNPLVVEHSISISDLSFDDTVNIRNNNSIKLANVTKNSFNENKYQENTTCTEFDNVKNFWLKISENVPPPVSDSTIYNNSIKSTSLLSTSCNNKQSLNDAIINTSTDSAFNDSMDTVGEYYKFVLGAIHKSNSDFPIKNIDRTHPHSLSNISLSLTCNTVNALCFLPKNTQNDYGFRSYKDMNLFVS